MRLTGIHHHSVQVTDLERAAHFYRDILGLREIPSPSNFPNPVRWFELGDQHLHCMLAPEPDRIGPRHVALHVDDAQAAREYLRSRGVEIEETWAIAGADRFMIRDPDGNRIEIIQWFRRWDEESERVLGVPAPGARGAWPPR